MLGVLALAVTAVVFLTWQVLSARSDAAADAELTHEATKFRAYAGSPTAASLTTPEDLLDRWLQSNLPDTSEAFFTIVDGRAYHRSQGTPPARLDTDTAFVQRIGSATTPQYGWVDSTAGKVRYAVIPVRVGTEPVRAQLVLLEFRDLLAQPLEDAAKALALIGLVTLAMAAGACWIVTGRVLAPIRQVRATAEQIGASDLRRRIDVVGNDDVAQLARTFNTMLDRLEFAFTAQREFVDNAGHELRTPITVIRGHLELMSDDPRDREQTRALILDELARMNRMVDDLLVLAKSGRPDFLELEQVNLTELVVEAVAKARPLADRTWRVDESADASMLADGQRLTQALMQLVSNAVRHTRPGDRISVGSRVIPADPDGPARVLLWVEDSGAGVCVADRERIFDRFARGNDQGRTDGAGLGLAIVRSIARAHGGDARLADGGGPGARFELELPFGPAVEQSVDEELGEIVESEEVR
ncbi:histidine kinase [Kribbella flavida DSM 17836]|uniref:histidine kinase n=1 Tax=Kribbella flavida (strain DSM 17836 / JCM 10339 / NBRC 14399) TaxID=479435 RepID=D2PT77_KRIFD|nr:HAMP domain-containing sensor histidine kinase [Kribbella flavida]ADB29393.1 histidine kinase [Kribbella flavida DSM 17836]